MNNEKNNEVLSREEMGKINEKLKTFEDIKLPESLSPENIAAQLSGIQQFVPEDEKKVKSRKKRLWVKALATAAAFVVAFTSVMIIKPWNRIERGTDNLALRIQPYAENHAEIEELFLAYSKNYKKYHSQNNLSGVLGGFFGNKAESFIEDGAIAEDDAMNVGAGDGSALQNYNTNVELKEESSSEHGKTNEQVEGVSEADIIKNDGKYLYVVNPDNADWEGFYNDFYKHADKNTVPDLDYNCIISILEPQADETIKNTSTIKIAAPKESNIYHMAIEEVYVSGKKLIALVQCREYSEDAKKDLYYGYGEAYKTMAVCFDITNRAKPVESWRVYQDGSYISSRLIGNQLVIISDYYVDISAEEESVKAKCIPTSGTEYEYLRRIPCERICIMQNMYDSCYLVASTMNISDENTLKTTAVLGAGEDVYCTTETLYAVSTEYKTQSGIEDIFGVTTTDTQIYKFDITNGDIKLVCNGSVKGATLNQFSMDEYKGYLRIATTTGNWGSGLENQLYVLDKDLKVVGSIENIAKGETIKSVRFTGDTGYVVTFEQTDPLFVIDLSDPKKPEIKGELKIPGFSTYLHPVGENLVLGVGVDGNSSGQNGGMKVSLFDVSDPENPVECDKVTIDIAVSESRWEYIDSAAYYTHKALCWNSAEKTMYIPYGKHSSMWTNDGNRVYNNSCASVLAVTVDVTEKKLSSSADYVSDKSADDSAESFERVTYMGEIIFGYAQNENILTGFDKQTQKQLYSINLN